MVARVAVPTINQRGNGNENGGIAAAATGMCRIFSRKHLKFTFDVQNHLKNLSSLDELSR